MTEDLVQYTTDSSRSENQGFDLVQIRNTCAELTSKRLVKTLPFIRVGIRVFSQVLEREENFGL